VLSCQTPKSLSFFPQLRRNAWLAVLRCELPAEAYRRVLVRMHDAIIPVMPNPLLLADFLSASVDQGGLPGPSHLLLFSTCASAACVLEAASVSSGGSLWDQVTFLELTSTEHDHASLLFLCQEHEP
jgi:hypothetical protein